ncbi:hypothetical protein Tco_0986189 [Tanacetum coccineum]
MQLRPAYNARNVRRRVLDDRSRPVSANDAPIRQPLANRSVEPSRAPIEGLCETTGSMVVIDNVPVKKAYPGKSFRNHCARHCNIMSEFAYQELGIDQRSLWRLRAIGATDEFRRTRVNKDATIVEVPCAI